MGVGTRLHTYERSCCYDVIRPKNISRRRKSHFASKMAFQDVGPLMFGPTEDVVRFFRTRNVLARSVQCAKYVKGSILMRTCGVDVLTFL